MTGATPSPDRKRRFKLFRPILPGANPRERAWACVGALVGVALAGLLTGLLFGADRAPLIVAPMGASAVLLFAVPASPLAQPWAIIGGNTISAAAGVLVACFTHDPALAIGLGVALAIAAMSVTRSLHPPGGAAALTAVLGGPVVAHWGFLFPLVPVALNSCLLVGSGMVFHKLSRRQYPHVAVPANVHHTADAPPSARGGFLEEDIDRALESLHESLDIDRGDLSQLLRRVELSASIRAHRAMLCADIMSRDVVTVGENAAADHARHLLLYHRIRTLPVTGADGRLVGMVGLRELVDVAGSIAGAAAPVATAAPDDPALGLLPILTDGRSHAVVIVDGDGRIAGLVTQTDLLAAVGRSLYMQPRKAA